MLSSDSAKAPNSNVKLGLAPVCSQLYFRLRWWLFGLLTKNRLVRSGSVGDEKGRHGSVCWLSHGFWIQSNSYNHRQHIDTHHHHHRIFGIFGQILELLVEKTCFLISPAKTLQNHLEISSKTLFWNHTCKIQPNVGNRTCPHLPRPVQEDKYLLQTSGNIFIFSDFIKSLILLNEFIMFYKIIGCTKRIYHFL